MTNIDYYGVENLRYLTFFSVKDGQYAQDIYYIPKHSRNVKSILLETFVGDKVDLINSTLKWLFEESKY